MLSHAKKRLNIALSKMMIPVLSVTPDTAINFTKENIILSDLPEHTLSPRQAKHYFLQKKYPGNFISHKIPCEDFMLDAMQFIPENVPEEKSALHIIFFLGNFCAYEYVLEEIFRIAKKYRCHAWLFNYRGASESEGVAEGIQDLIIDGKYVTYFLLKRGISPEKIILRGHSLGGAVSVGTAFALLQEKIKINLFVNRTFSSTAAVSLGHFRLKFEYPRGPEYGKRQPQFKRLGKWFSIFMRPIAVCYLASNRANIDFSDLYLRIPAPYKECLGVTYQTPLQKDLDIPADFKIHPTARFENGLEKTMQFVKNLLIECMLMIEQLKNNLDNPEKTNAMLIILRTKTQTARANVSAIVHAKLSRIEEKIYTITRAYQKYQSEAALPADVKAMIEESLAVLSNLYSEISDRFLFAYKMSLLPNAPVTSNAHSIPLSSLYAACNQSLSGDELFNQFFNLVKARES